MNEEKMAEIDDMDMEEARKIALKNIAVMEEAIDEMPDMIKNESEPIQRLKDILKQSRSAINRTKNLDKMTAQQRKTLAIEHLFLVRVFDILIGKDFAEIEEMTDKELKEIEDVFK